MDKHQNFKETFLGLEGAFSEFRILVGLFYSFKEDFLKTAGAEF